MVSLLWLFHSSFIPMTPQATGKQSLFLFPKLHVICLSNTYSSKKWNKFDLWAMLLAGLPRAVNSRLENIHLICCSNEASAIEMADPIVDDLLKLENEGLVTYDALLGQEVIVIAPLICAICDNPRASEIPTTSGVLLRNFAECVS